MRRMARRSWFPARAAARAARNPPVDDPPGRDDWAVRAGPWVGPPAATPTPSTWHPATSTSTAPATLSTVPRSPDGAKEEQQQPPSRYPVAGEGDIGSDRLPTGRIAMLNADPPRCCFEHEALPEHPDGLRCRGPYRRRPGCRGHQPGGKPTVGHRRRRPHRAWRADPVRVRQPQPRRGRPRVPATGMGSPRGIFTV
jgi:hypothetical protein